MHVFTLSWLTSAKDHRPWGVRRSSLHKRTEQTTCNLMGNVSGTQRRANIRTIKLVYKAHIVAVSFSSSSPGLGDRSLPQQLSWLPWTAKETRVLTVTPTSTISFPGRQDCPTFPAMTTSWSSAGTFLIRTRAITFYKHNRLEMQLQCL